MDVMDMIKGASAESKLAEGKALFEEGDKILYAVKHQLDQAKIAFDESKEAYAEERLDDCLVKLMESHKHMMTIAMMIDGKKRGDETTV